MFLVSLNSPSRLAGILFVIGAFAINVHAVNVPRERILLDSGWRFQLGDPPDVTTNVTVYPGTMTNYYSSTYSFRAGYGALDATGNYFNGVIDEVALFDRALTASQLQSLYLAAIAGGPIRLQIQLISDKVILTWPLDHTGWQLQVQTNAPGAGLATNWNAVAGSVLTNQFTMPIDPANGGVFFRLLHP